MTDSSYLGTPASPLCSTSKTQSNPADTSSGTSPYHGFLCKCASNPEEVQRKTGNYSVRLLWIRRFPLYEPIDQTVNRFESVVPYTIQWWTSYQHHESNWEMNFPKWMKTLSTHIVGFDLLSVQLHFAFPMIEAFKKLAFNGFRHSRITCPVTFSPGLKPSRSRTIFIKSLDILLGESWSVDTVCVVLNWPEKWFTWFGKKVGKKRKQFTFLGGNKAVLVVFAQMESLEAWEPESLKAWKPKNKISKYGFWASFYHFFLMKTGKMQWIRSLE